MSSKTVIAIVDAYSSGSQMAREAKALGCACVMVQSAEDIPVNYRSSFHAEYFDATICHRGNLEETCRELKARNVGCVIAGCEMGVELSDQLSERLGMVSNGTRLSPARRNKWLMGEALQKRGVRTAGAFSSPHLDQILDWVRVHGNWPVVIKPLCSSGSDGVRLCRNEAEVQSAFQDIISQPDVFDAANEEVLVQEFLSGTEFAVDTVSYSGRHKVVAFWEYGAPVADRSSLGSGSMELLPYSSSLNQRLVPYVTSVLDALDIKNGPAHCEIIWHDDCPIIVEVGARLNGGNNPSLSRLCGCDSQIDMTLDAYLHPERFLEHVDEPYLLSKRAMRVFLTPRPGDRLKSLPRFDEVEQLDSFNELRFWAKPGQILSRIAGWVLLVHEDRAVIHQDLQQIRRLENSGLYEIEPDV